MFKFIGKVFIGVIVVVITIWLIGFVIVDLHQYANDQRAKKSSAIISDSKNTEVVESDESLENRMIESCKDLVLSKFKNPEGIKFNPSMSSVTKIEGLPTVSITLLAQSTNQRNTSTGYFVCTIKSSDNGNLDTKLTMKSITGYF